MTLVSASNGISENRIVDWGAEEIQTQTGCERYGGDRKEAEQPAAQPALRAGSRLVRKGVCVF